MKAVIMAGGKGTRISTLFPDVPKPMIEIKDNNGVAKPVLQWELESLRNQGFSDIIITIGYKAQQIVDHFGNGEEFGVKISYYVEESPLGNAGALFKIRDELGNEPFFFLIADAMFDIDFHRMLKYHNEHNALVTLFTHPNSHPYDSSLLVVDENGAVQRWLTKEDTRPKYYKNRVNAGVQIIDPRILDMSGIVGEDVGNEYRVDMDRMLLKPLCGKGVMFCYDSSEYCKDMGTPERFVQVSKDFETGIVSAKNLKHFQKAFFLDIDGIINKHIKRGCEFELLPGVDQVIRLINNSGYLAIVMPMLDVVVTEGSSIGELSEINNKLDTELGKAGAYIDGAYFSAIHFDGDEVDCCKAGLGQMLRAVDDFNVQLSKSWVISYSHIGILTGKKVGCMTAMIGNKDNNGADLYDNNLLDVVKKILSGL